MLQLARLTDYGIVLMTHMADGPEGRLYSSTELTEATHLPGPTVSKVLKQLGREGLLDSQRGADGGYALARPAERISVADVIRALEGPIALTLCSQGAGSCELEPHCQVGPNWQLINDALRRALEGITLADMGRPMPARTLDGLTLAVVPDPTDGTSPPDDHPDHDQAADAPHPPRR